MLKSFRSIASLSVAYWCDTERLSVLPVEIIGSNPETDYVYYRSTAGVRHCLWTSLHLDRKSALTWLHEFIQDELASVKDYAERLEQIGEPDASDYPTPLEKCDPIPVEF